MARSQEPEHCSTAYVTELQDALGECKDLVLQADVLLKDYDIILRKETALNKKLLQENSRLVGELTAPEPWYQSPWFLLATGFITGVMVVK